ncbi:hypothetical protein [Ottowia sp.]|uniref:hypothetical protein n=1 Tax=Ottowia sp. TaxID=1898956 RepID=UPI0039E5916A
MLKIGALFGMAARLAWFACAGLAASTASAGPWNPMTRYPRELRGAWMLGHHPGCRAADVPRNASDLVIKTDHIRALESRHELVSLRKMARRFWQAAERVSRDHAPATLLDVSITLSRDGRTLTRSYNLSNGLIDEEQFTRCR